MKNNMPFSRNLTYYTLQFVSLSILSVFFLIQPGNVASVKAQGSEIRGTFGAWQLKCGRAPGSRVEKCALVQSVTAEDRPNVGLTVIFLKSIDGKRQMLRIIAPLGVLLPTGLGLKIDGADIGHAKFLKCGRIGCIAEVAAGKDLVSKFTSGQQAVFIIFPTPEEGLGIPIQLRGFKQGVSGLK